MPAQTAVLGVEGVDAPVPWHYGNPHAEQRALVEGRALVDLSHRGVVEVSGPDRLSWLHSLSTGALLDLRAGGSAMTLILDPHGHVEHIIALVELGDRCLLVVEPGEGAVLAAYLDSMRFMLRVEVADRSADIAAVWSTLPEPAPADLVAADVVPLAVWRQPAEFTGTGTTPAGTDRGGDAAKYVPHRPAALPGRLLLVPRDRLAQLLAQAPALAGSWALEALRVAAAVPRLGLETDHRTLPHEIGLIGPAVHLAKGCYRGQESVARVHNLGRPPRRLALAHLDGSTERLPEHGTPVLVDGREVGWVGTAVRHYEEGQLATVILKRNVPTQAPLTINSHPAAQTPVVLP